MTAAAVAVVMIVAVSALLHLLGRSESDLLWADEFTGAEGSAPVGWTAETGYFGEPYRSLECMTAERDNSSLDGNGHLNITARRAPGTHCGSTTRDYTSARLTSRNFRQMKYGYVEFRAKMATGSGAWNALWLLGSNYAEVGWPRCGELDVTEVVGSKPRESVATAHGPSETGGSRAISDSREMSADLGAAYHLYAMEWSSAKISFSIDGMVYNVVQKREQNLGMRWVFDHGFDIVMSLTVGGDRVGPPTAGSDFPQRMSIDFMRLYRHRPAEAGKQRYRNF